MRASGLRPWWIAVATVAVAAYLVALGGLHIPHIGDEAPYLEITRLTAESGRLLPLQTAKGLESTKPPLLFWTGIASTDGGRVWTLWRLRLPMVAFTFLTAAVAFLVGRRIAPGSAAGILAALTYLAFGTTFQYGRPFLTNAPETLFLFLPFALAALRPARLDGWGFWVVAGLSVGIATLFKSFALVLPVAFAFSLWLLSRRGWRVVPFLRHDVGRVALAVALALACFALWPLLDPDPRSVIDNFVIRENFGKVGSEGGYLAGLVSPAHGLHMTLLGPLLNAVFLALPLLLLVSHDVRHRLTLTDGERGLWWMVVAFVIFYTLPSHRQSNYLLPVMPALAVLLGARWMRLSVGWLRIAAVPLVAVAIGLLTFLLVLRFGTGEESLSVPLGLFLAPLGALVIALLAVHTRWGAPWLFHLGVFLVFLGIAAAASPFEREGGRFPESTVEAVAGHTVYVPSTFRRRHERHRFLLRGADVRGYPRSDADLPVRLYERGEIVALVGPAGEPLAPADAEVLGRRLDLRTRQTQEELLDLLLHQNLDVLLQQEIIVRRGKTASGSEAP